MQELEFGRVDVQGAAVYELKSGVVANERGATDLVGNAAFMAADYLLVDVKRLAPDFFDLSTGLAGTVMQKFSNYRVSLVIVGYDRSKASGSLSALIRESNRGSTIWFVADREEALTRIRGR